MPQVKHIAFMRFLPQTPREEIGDVYAALEDLKTKIPGLLDFTGGPYSSPEGLNKGFTHAFVMTFEDAAARDVYLTHPAHETVKDQILALLDGGIDAVAVFDFEVCDRFRY
jgi:hypothetical protein